MMGLKLDPQNKAFPRDREEVEQQAVSEAEGGA